MRRHVTLLAAALVAAPLFAQPMDRTKPPSTPPLPPFHLPSVYETKLPNGLELVLVEDARFPLVTIRLAFRAGSRFDPAELRGLTAATGSLLMQGTKTRPARQIAEEAASMGGDIVADTSPDTLIVGASALSENSEKLLALVSDVARNASFPENEVNLYKQNRKQRLIEQSSQPEFLADEKLTETLFGSHPYSRTNPTLESIDKLDVTALTKFRDTYLAPNNAILIVLGKMPRRPDLMKILNADFGDWKTREIPAQPAVPIPAPHKSITLVDRPGSVQADVHVGHIGVTRTSPEYFPLTVGNAILGGGTASRLFNNIREKEGYAYSVYSHIMPLKDSGVFDAAMQVRNEVTGPALQAMLKELSGMASAQVSAAELTNVKNYLSGVFVMRLQTQDGLASQLAGVKAIGMPIDYLEKYTTRIRSTEPDQIESAAKKIIAPEESSIVVVGDAKQIGPALEKFGKVEVTREK